MKANDAVLELLQSFEEIFNFFETLLNSSANNKQALTEANAKIDELEQALEFQDSDLYESLLPSLERAKELNKQVLAATASETPVESTPTDSVENTPVETAPPIDSAETTPDETESVETQTVDTGEVARVEDMFKEQA